MHTGWTIPLLSVVLCLAAPLRAQYEAPAETVLISGSVASTWVTDKTSILQLEGPVSIDLDKTHLTARQAVVWISTVPGSVADVKRIEIALVGEAFLTQPNDVTRSGPLLYIDARARGVIRISAAKRLTTDQNDSDLYRSASSIRPVLLKGGQLSGRWIIDDQSNLPPTAATQPADRFRPLQPVTISAVPGNFDLVETPEGKVAAVFSGKVTVLQTTSDGNFLELLADRAVIFTPYASLKQLPVDQKLKSIEQAVTGAYLEGDVRMIRTPKDPKQPDQRLTANRAYYDFTTDRAVLTDVVMHTTDPRTQIPMIVRARIVRQLSYQANMQEYNAQKARLSVSSFNTPSYSIGASSTYIRQEETTDVVTGARTTFVAKDAVFDIWGMPVFYTPVVAGTLTERNLLRRIETSSGGGFGLGASTEWGLFESLGRLPPKGTDASYKLDYYSKRGPATGIDGRYTGGFVDDRTLQPWTYSGDFKSYLVLDQGKDDLGERRVDVTPESELRGRVFWEHQQFFPGDWQVQMTAAYVSDPTFMEEWFNREFRTSRPQETSLYIKHQRDSEVITFLVAGQPNSFVTTSDLYQEQVEVQRLPEVGYHRIGDSLWDDHGTFFSHNSIAGLEFRHSNASLADLGFAAAPVGRFSPGIPAIGQTGTPSDLTYRGDSRQEVDFPFSLYRFRVMPYVIGRYTDYTQGVDGGNAERLYAATGVRITTAFWKVDDSVQSELLDLHRLRHVVEPEVNLFTSAQSKDRSEFLNYDEPIDAINDITAMQFALNQRWQTKRGGPGQWRSVDVFTLNTEYNFFTNQPNAAQLDPTSFRGLYFVSMPEASIPRNSANADATWRVSDSVQILSDVQYNTDDNKLATASIGLSVRQDTRLNYYLGLRHIGLNLTEIINGNTFVFEDQDLVIFAVDYQLTSKYRVQFANGYDLAQHRNDRSTVSLIRRFDRFYAAIGFRVDQFQGESAVFFNLWPEGLQPGGGSQAANGAFHN